MQEKVGHVGRPEKGPHPKLHPDSQAAQANPNEGPWAQAGVCDGIKEPAQVGADASTQGGAERVNEQMGVVLGWKMLQTLAESPDTLPSP